MFSLAQEQTVSSEKPTREGYTFSRWTTTDVEVKDDKTFTMPEKECNLYRTVDG